MSTDLVNPTVVLPPFPQSEGVEYRPIPGFFGYCVGSDGTLWSTLLPNKKSRKYSTQWTLKRSWPTRDGYRLTCLRDDGGERRLFLHTLVLMSFVGPRPKGYDTLHIDGDPANNRLENLRWGSRKENCADTRRHGRLAERERNGHARLSELKVKAVHVLLAAGWTQYDVATVFRVSQPTISNVVTGVRWQER